MTDPICYLNGDLCPLSQLVLPISDCGWIYGATVTDRLRTFGKQFVRMTMHLDRFMESCRLARVRCRLPYEEIKQLLSELLHRNIVLIPQVQDWSFILLATPGNFEQSDQPTLVVQVQPLNLARYRPFFQRGFRLKFSPSLIPETVVSPSIKHRSRLHWWISEHAIDRVEGVDLLYVGGEESNCIRETSIANFLAVIDETVVSPPWEKILPGIALRSIQEICEFNEIRFECRELTTETILQTTTEAMLTNSTFGVAGVSQIEGKRFPWPGPITERLSEAFSRRIQFDIRSQILNV